MVRHRPPTGGQVGCPPGQFKLPSGECVGAGVGGGQVGCPPGQFRLPSGECVGHAEARGIWSDLLDLGVDVLRDELIGGDGGGVPGGGGGAVPFGECDDGFERDSNGVCVARAGGIIGGIRRFLPGGATGLMGAGEPLGISRTVRRCGRGAVLARDGMCYDKRSLTNKQRWWPKPRRPLLTGGDLNAINRASRAATRLTNATKRLQKLGMMAKPKRAGARRRAPAHLAIDV